MQIQNRNDDPNNLALLPVLRWMSNIACLWHLCSNVACTRARQCKRDPRFCMRRYAPLLPDEVRDGIKLMVEGKQRGVSYEDLRAEAPIEIGAVEGWIARVEAAQ